MEKDAIQNQKVYVTLRSVIELTTEYRRICEEYKAARNNGDTGNLLFVRKGALEFVIRTLALPINI